MTPIRTYYATLLPFFLFTTFTALAFNFIFGHLFSSGLADSLQAQCPPSSNLSKYPNRLAYTNYDPIDTFLCGIVSFFQLVLLPPEKNLNESPGSDSRKFVEYFLAEAFPGLAFMVIESWRYKLSVQSTGESGRWGGLKWALSTFSLWGMSIQLLSGGALIPLFCMVFLLLFSPSSSASTRTISSPSPTFTTTHASAILYGLVMGALVPSIAMYKFADPLITAIWQFFPLYVSGFKHLYFKLQRQRQRRRGQVGLDTDTKYNTNDNDGKRMIILIYVLTGIIAIWAHISTSWRSLYALLFKGKSLSAFNYLSAFWFPARLLSSLLGTYQNSTLTPSEEALEFLHWDALFACVSAIVGTLWFGKTNEERVKVVVWYTLALPILGPGMAMAGVFVWRELRGL